MVMIKVVHTFQGASGIAKDRFVNSWYFTTTQAYADIPYSSIADSMITYYDSQVLDIGGSFFSLYSPFALGPGATVKIYATEDPLKSPPRYERSYDPANSGASAGMPEEVAICFSFEGVPAPPVNQARRRGRLYFGPLSSKAVTADNTDLGGTVPSRPGPLIRAAIFTGMPALLTALGVDLLTWVARSETTGLQASTPITRAWIDDAWDTQRRRGVGPTAKSYLTFP